MFLKGIDFNNRSRDFLEYFKLFIESDRLGKRTISLSVLSYRHPFLAHSDVPLPIICRDMVMYYDGDKRYQKTENR